jgi:hypothetical protein
MLKGFFMVYFLKSIHKNLQNCLLLQLNSNP